MFVFDLSLPSTTFSLILPLIFCGYYLSFSFTLYSIYFSLNFFFYYLVILLYNIVLVLPYIDLNLPWVYMYSPSWTPPPKSLPIPSLWVIPVHQPLAYCIMHQTKWMVTSILNYWILSPSSAFLSFCYVYSHVLLQMWDLDHKEGWVL